MSDEVKTTEGPVKVDGPQVLSTEKVGTQEQVVLPVKDSLKPDTDQPADDPIARKSDIDRSIDAMKELTKVITTLAAAWEKFRTAGRF